MVIMGIVTVTVIIIVVAVEFGWLVGLWVNPRGLGRAGFCFFRTASGPSLAARRLPVNAQEIHRSIVNLDTLQQ
jgi:hypothetical protein